MTDEQYFRYLRSLGFDEETATQIVAGRHTENMLTREAFMKEVSEADSADDLSEEAHNSALDTGDKNE